MHHYDQGVASAQTEVPDARIARPDLPEPRLGNHPRLLVAKALRGVEPQERRGTAGAWSRARREILTVSEANGPWLDRRWPDQYGCMVAGADHFTLGPWLAFTNAAA